MQYNILLGYKGKISPGSEMSDSRPNYPTDRMYSHPTYPGVKMRTLCSLSSPSSDLMRTLHRDSRTVSGTPSQHSSGRSSQPFFKQNKNVRQSIRGGSKLGHNIMSFGTDKHIFFTGLVTWYQCEQHYSPNHWPGRQLRPVIRHQSIYPIKISDRPHSLKSDTCKISP